MFFAFIILLLPLASVCDDKVYAYLTWDPAKDEPSTVLTSNTANEDVRYFTARAIYHNQVNETGWAYLELHTTDGLPDDRQAFGGGYLEGFLTHDMIWMSWVNTMGGFCKGKQAFCDRLDNYTSINYWFIQDMVHKMNGSDPYWHQIYLVYLQIHGMYSGYNKAAPSDRSLTLTQFLWMNMMGDLEDLQEVLADKKSLQSRKEMGRGRCSALIKLLDGNSDILAGHTTWTVYESMLRIQKKYVFNYRVSKTVSNYIPARSISMSSYPGYVHSADDFYVLSSGLVTLETTISNDNHDLWTKISPKGQVLEFVRTMVANRLASNGKEWVAIFRKYNSGTYNNEWMVLDYNRFKPNNKGPLKSGVLWVLEQLPGYTEAADLTNVLESQRYFPSYNTPYFPTVFNMSGQLPFVSKFGDWFTYDRTPRALIFKRDQGKIRDLASMMDVLRYNDFRHDPLSACNCTPPYSGENSIAARSDLNLANGTYPFPALEHRDHGASDAKITSWGMVRKLQLHSVSSPPFNESRGIPPFQWSTADFGRNTSHLGHPDLWNFTPLTHEWEWELY